jgi:hypothetical protein
VGAVAAPIDGGFAQLEPGAPTEIGRYRLYARLGAGGMGQVFLSFLPGGRPVALKVVRPEFSADPEFRRRFAQEARAAQQVNGIHIAQLLDADPDATVPWLATAYIPGPSLLEAVRLHGPLPVDSVRTLTAGVAKALEAIHAAGLIHRDLKPANVILAADGPRVIDFGIARAADATTASLTGKRVGSPQYMAPEQIRGLPATPALDVFALGALAFFAATGRPAFGEGEDLAVIFRVVQETPDLSGCPSELQPLVAACLAKDPAARPDLRAVLEACRAPDTAATGYWLPPALAEAIAARTNAIAAAAAQPPTAPESAVPTRSGAFATTAATAATPLTTTAPSRTLGARLKVGAITLGFGVLIGAVVALAVIRSPGSGNNQAIGQHSNSPTAGPATTGGFSPQPADTAVQDTASGATGTGSALPNAGTDAVQWEGAITFGKSGLNLDDIPPDTANLYPDVSYVGSAGSSSYNLSGSWAMAVWTNGGVPTRSECSALIISSGDQGVVASVNTLICVKTGQGRIALVQVQGVDTGLGQVSAYARVWAQEISP